MIFSYVFFQINQKSFYRPNMQTNLISLWWWRWGFSFNTNFFRGKLSISWREKSINEKQSLCIPLHILHSCLHHVHSWKCANILCYVYIWILKYIYVYTYHNMYTCYERDFLSFDIHFLFILKCRHVSSFRHWSVYQVISKNYQLLCIYWVHRLYWFKLYNVYTRK